MEMKIVGAASDEETAEEIEDIARVFVYEQHLKDCTQPLRLHTHPPREPSIRRPIPPPNQTPLKTPTGYVKGFY
jgi:hypothetical protein